MSLLKKIEDFFNVCLYGFSSGIKNKIGMFRFFIGRRNAGIILYLSGSCLFIKAFNISFFTCRKGRVTEDFY